ncbi:hypothetical protein FACS1894155_05710 [Bacteroidia bacterium]|nr:hypothetical protein FACS1894155_05710 [Bacteroidia bacterium]
MENELNNDVRSLAMGNLFALGKEFSNPAFLSFQSGSKISTSVYNRFQMSELNSSCLRLIYPSRFLDAGIQLNHFGFKDYYCLSVLAGLAKQINSCLSVGLKTNLSYWSSLLDSKPVTAISASLGVVYSISNSLKTGFLAENIATTLNSTNYSIHAGIDYQCLEDLALVVETSYNAESKFDIRLGAEYRVVESLSFKAGVQSNPSSPTIGFSYTFKQINIGTAFMMHQTLGNSTMIEIGYKF